MHDLDFNRDGLARFAYQAKHLSKVWHRHGTQVPNGLRTLEEWLEAADMQFSIERAELFAKINGEMVPVPSHRLIYRDTDQKQLSVMGKGYRPVQTWEAWRILEECVTGGLLEIDTIGTLNGGKRTFVAASLVSDPLEVVPGDKVEKYFTCADSWDGSMALTFVTTGVLSVCQNTVRAAINDATSIAKGRHTENVLGTTSIDKIREALGLAEVQFSEFAEFGKQLASIRMSDSEVYDFHKALVLGDKKYTPEDDWSGQARRAIGELGWLMDHGPGQEIEGRAGTAWGALNSVTAWTNHVKNHRRDVTTDRTQFVLFGNGNSIASQATQLLVNQYQLAA